MRSRAVASSAASFAIAAGRSSAGSASAWARVVTPVSIRMQGMPSPFAAARSVAMPSPTITASARSMPALRIAISRRCGAGLPIETGVTWRPGLDRGDDRAGPGHDPALGRDRPGSRFVATNRAPCWTQSTATASFW